MKAVQLVKYGDPVDSIEVRDITAPLKPQNHEVLVGVKYSPINYSDLMVVRDLYPWKPTPPATMGNEGAGVVLEVGNDVTRFAPGDKVVLPFMSQSWREQLLVDEERLVLLPDDSDLQQASMLTINAVTTYQLLYDFVTLRPGDAIAYNAATSGLGHWIAGLAASAGFKTVGFVRKHEDIERVRASGCDVVLLDADESLNDERLKELNIRLALDGVGGDSAGRLTGILGYEGTLVAYAAASKKAMSVSAQHLIFKRLTLHGFFEGHQDRTNKIPATLAKLVEYVRSNGIAQPITAVHTVDELDIALAAAVNGKKVLLAF